MHQIMIVDNHPLIGMGLGSLLSTHGYDVIANESTGDNTVKTALLLQPELIILDLYLPDYHGLEVIRVIRDTGLKTKIIVFTGYNDMNYQLQCRELGVEGFMLKSELSESLVSVVASVMSGNICYPSQNGQGETSGLQLNGVSLTRKEKVILEYLASGMNNRDIAYKLKISDKTVSTHKRRIMAKFQVDTVFGLLSKIHPLMDARMLS